MGESEICRGIPVRGYMVRQADGSWEMDPARSTYADIPADVLARFLLQKFGKTAVLGEE